MSLFSPASERSESAFLFHLIAATAATVAGLAVALVAGFEGHLAFFLPVVILGGLGGAFAGQFRPDSGVAWVVLPAGIWFAGWAGGAIYSDGLGSRFVTAFIGTGYCGDFSCTGQILVTAPLVGTVCYAVAARVAAQRRAASIDEGE